MLTPCKDDSQVQCEFQQAGERRLEADFESGQITRDAGAVLLWEAAHRTGMLCDLAGCFNDHRDPQRISRSLISQRALGIEDSYEDPLDHTTGCGRIPCKVCWLASRILHRRR